jgi:hypothetical protein
MPAAARMTKEMVETLERLKRIGVITSDGQLGKDYRPDPDFYSRASDDAYMTPVGPAVTKTKVAKASVPRTAKPRAAKSK